MGARAGAYLEAYQSESNRKTTTEIRGEPILRSCDDLLDQQAQIKDAAKQYFAGRRDDQVDISTYDNPLLFLESLDQNGALTSCF
ncbi:MAG: hypothetical protein APF81_04770 [Desulfosporosinus sp. BRH_c37]|nr:MAG: hypothetical protein APF81_04770 [Desulfosporosinus sp. BRH_c37]